MQAKTKSILFCEVSLEYIEIELIYRNRSLKLSTDLHVHVTI